MGLLIVRGELRELLEILGDERKPNPLPDRKVETKESDDTFYESLCNSINVLNSEYLS